MSEDSLTPDGSPTDDILESEQLVARLVEFDEALELGFTLDLTDDDTLRSLPDETHRESNASSGVSSSSTTSGARKWQCGSMLMRFPASRLLLRHATCVQCAASDWPVRDRTGTRSRAHGIVFQARDRILDRQVAVKVPRPEVVLSPQLRKRLADEGKTAAKLHHPNIITVLESGDFGPCCYIAQELCIGPSLAVWLAAREPVAIEVAVQVMVALATTVQYAHSQGVLHRDLKPSNVLLQPLGVAAESSDIRSLFPYTVKLTDFGIAKVLLEEVDRNATLTGTVMGTAAYMSPEQASGKGTEVGEPSDIYGLGAILYELLSGRPPIQGESQIELLRHVLTEDVVPLRLLRPDVPRDLDSVCLKCLEKKPAERYTAAADLAADLNRFLDGEAVRRSSNKSPFALHPPDTPPEIFVASRPGRNACERGVADRHRREQLANTAKKHRDPGNSGRESTTAGRGSPTRLSR